MAQKNSTAKKPAPNMTAPKKTAPRKAASKKSGPKKSGPVKTGPVKTGPKKTAKAAAPSPKAPPAKAASSKTVGPKTAGRVKKSAEEAVGAVKKPAAGISATAKKDAPTKAGATSVVANDGAGTRGPGRKAAEKPQAAVKTPVEKATPIIEPPPNGSGGRGGARKADKGREDTPPPKPGKATSRYSVGDKVVHPQHGAATIAKRIKREFGGQVRDYYVLEISTESLTVMVPVEKVDSVVRSVISKTQSRNVLASLKEEPQEAGANWSRWYKVLTEKMYSGDIFQVAEVVRDLSFAQQTKGISPALKRMLSKARMTLISELSFSLEEDEDEATKRLDKALPKIETALAPIE